MRIRSMASIKEKCVTEYKSKKKKKKKIINV